jgi:hypothetical protein
MTIADAEREVLSWALPANEARIERSIVLTVADFLASRSSGAGAMQLAESPSYSVLIDEDGRVPDPFAHGKVTMAPDRVLILVDASQQGMDLSVVKYEGEERPSLCSSVSSRSRARFVAFFDATRGQYLGMDFISPTFSASWMDDLAKAPPVHLLPIGSPTPTPTVTLTAVPLRSPTPYPTVPNAKHKPTLGLPEDATEERLLGTGQVPAPLVDAAREMAEVPGSQWVYRVTDLDQGVHWSQHVVTNTIHSAWRIAPDVMMLRRRVCQSPETNPGPDPTEAATRCRDEDRYYVLPGGRVTGDQEDLYASPLAALRKELEGTPSPDSGNRDIIAQLRVPLRTNEYYGDADVDWSTGGRESIVVPRGRFDGCIAVMGSSGPMNVDTYWTCPGIGVVRLEGPGCHTMGGGFALYELIDYDIPPIVPLP